MFENAQINTDNLPKLQTVQFEQIHRDYIKVIFFNILLIFLVLLVTTIVNFHFNAKVKELAKPLYVYIVLVMFFLFQSVYYYASFFKRKYALRQQDITYKKGLFFKSTLTIPFNRIQHIEIDEGLFSRIFSLASINIYTAGANNLDLAIKGIPKKKAAEIKEFITATIHA